LGKCCDEGDHSGDSGRGPSADFVFKGLKVLAVEDNSISLELLRILLEKLECTVVTASNGREAIEKIRQNTFNICLMDLCMPEMGGIEATMEIRKIAGNEFPVVAITASAMKGDEERCLDGGMKDYLPKPIDPARLKEKIMRWALR
jgi:two-component system, sensor histidine kinase and response regulator